ncbi:3-beta hydroxysteroid dehydrogenase [Mycobacterium colombiense]|uniref:3-beta hydroxysteroid dehydrogenase n=1 Tax=Mycobacterium colombiense TaxID=339268 RepID=A0A1A0VE00_9MYCO|nr:SDR family oxidoreductase [Mycobacterium colombiense]OBB81478.1 3-beta hydroxysteroid dehydrogenase [Mycobacterium colombiense]
MRVFVTGATGFVGSAIVAELLSAGHQVVGLARSQAAAASLRDAGAGVHRGALEDLDSLRRGAAAADGVIHTAYAAMSADFMAAAHTDRRAIETIGEALAGSGRPLVVTSATTFIAPGRLATEHDIAAAGTPRVDASEAAVVALAGRDVRASVLRLPTSVHGPGDHGFAAQLIGTARETGVSAYPGDGTNRWPAVHRLDAAVSYRLALEAAPAGARLHAVADHGVPVYDIAATISRHTQLPVQAITAEEAFTHFGLLGAIFALDVPASSEVTEKQLEWRPAQPGLLADLNAAHYYH